VELATGVGQVERAVGPLEQRHPQVVFQRSDLATDRRLRDRTLLTGGREAEQPRGGFEGCQQVQRRKAERIPGHDCLRLCPTPGGAAPAGTWMRWRNVNHAEISFERQRKQDDD